MAYQEMISMLLRVIQNLMHTRRSIAKSHQARYTTSNKKTYKTRTSTQLREILYPDYQDMLVSLYTCNSVVVFPTQILRQIFQ
jgi:hypothetical protein